MVSRRRISNANAHFQKHFYAHKPFQMKIKNYSPYVRVLSIYNNNARWHWKTTRNVVSHVDNINIMHNTKIKSNKFKNEKTRKVHTRKLKKNRYEKDFFVRV